ncbi:glycerate kinase type-2 family protein [Radicibacter daui]|uniref:glycerate kinase type-2 family protein n=1 Tax=Radicibacter daui TaxID=3064829 RepID=UPI004046A575
MPALPDKHAPEGEARPWADPRQFLRELFMVAVERADPLHCVPRALPPKPEARVVVVGAGKAAARMAEAVELCWGPCEGLVITRDGYARPLQGIEVLEASHPVPDRRGLLATKRLLALLQGCGDGDFVLALISGGGSALLSCPAGEITLEEEQALTAALLSSGAPINAMNIVRKHLSGAKGGRLAAAAYPATVLALIVSDVPGDDPAMIASGPTVGDISLAEEAREILQRWHIPLPASVEAVLAGVRQTVLPEDARLSRTQNRVIAAPAQSLEAAADRALAAGLTVHMLGDALEGEARELARAHAGQALELAGTLRPGDAPVLLLSGGECTVTRRGAGTGGPNAEYCLALAIALEGAAGIWALACDTDGVDGAAEVAGAMIGPGTLARAASRQVDPVAALEANDSHGFFARLGDQVVTGPTLTNVNDFRAILIQPPPKSG